ncbi:hypothetical protein BJQ94_00235 [Cryobacterium sp. SO2]|uniref:hypothetical protein n=1 Tax=Cryobacterium sp. SO2 TaxID=1897060 RepID=UPI00223E172A|nr:hypothetical protein [Cryobacterium sp. SO2]WEO77523.1 hypothetical protein BJQ94_00235 [Cryobacterium sp. SO2]
MAEQPVPFWRKIAEAVGLSEPGLPVGPAAPRTGSQSAPAPAAPAAAGPAVVPAAPAVPSPTPAAGGEPQPPAAPDAEALLELWFARAEDDVIAWRQCVPGPSAAEIGTRLSLVPAAFLSDAVAILPLAEHILETEYGASRAAPAARRAQDVLAVVDQVRATGSSAARRGAALVLWLWASDDLHGPLSVPLTIVLHDRALAALAFRLASVVDPAEWVSDADRRDEAARQFLFWSGHLPAGEDEATARSILTMRDSLQQNAALAQSLADHEHRLEVTRRLQAARAREAAARYSNE